jgi:alginate O-acetyltransferase complex protein AlgI
MLFNSWSFVVFLPVVFAASYLRRSVRWQAGVLTVASFLFYAWGSDKSGFPHWKLLPLLLLSTLVNSFSAEALLSPTATPGRRRRALQLALAFNLAALGLFKYGAFLGEFLLPAGLWAQWGPSIRRIPLPVGISFYTFQGISLVMECWWAGPAGFRGMKAPEPGGGRFWFHLRVWFFKAFFPQLVAGPIVKAGEFFHQVAAKRIRDIDWDGAVKRLVLGFFLKMVVADNLKDATNDLPHYEVLSRWNIVALIYAYSFQILADFGGYSLIAQGLGKLFGYELPDNFRLPYLSRSFGEFWRRWHISLSTWLRMYLYIPLGGNRRGAVRTYVNLFLVMFLGGLWHGNRWSYAVWGAAHGLFLAAERLLTGGEPKTPTPASIREEPRWTAREVVKALFVFHAVTLLWLLFRLPNFEVAVGCLKAVFTSRERIQVQALYVVAVFSTPVILWHLWHAAAGIRARWSDGIRRSVEIAAYASMAFLTAVNWGSPGDFIYFQF